MNTSENGLLHDVTEYLKTLNNMFNSTYTL